MDDDSGASGEQAGRAGSRLSRDAESAIRPEQPKRSAALSDLRAGIEATLSGTGLGFNSTLGTRGKRGRKAGSGKVGKGGGNPGAVGSGDGAGGEEEGALEDLQERERRAEYTERAKRWLEKGDGKADLLADIKRNLMINYQIEVREGQEIRETREGPSQARQSRKQAKEIAELLLEVMDLRVEE